MNGGYSEQTYGTRWVFVSLGQVLLERIDCGVTVVGLIEVLLLSVTIVILIGGTVKIQKSHIVWKS